MEPDRGYLSAAQAPRLDPAASRATGPELTRLRDAWRARSLASGWLADDDWHSEAVDAVVIAAYRAEAGADAGALASACTDLGRSRATAGIGITETIDDLAALFAVLHLVCCQAEGWTEENLAQLARDGGVTLSLARRNGPGPAIALVRAHADLPMRYARLRRSIQVTLGGQIRMTRLPRMLAEAHHLVDDCLLGERAR